MYVENILSQGSGMNGKVQDVNLWNKRLFTTKRMNGRDD